MAEKAVRTNSLVDDIWLMSDTKSELKVGIQEVQELMRHMGIGVHKWGSNCPELLQDIPKDRLAKEIAVTDCEGTAIKALGLIWDTEKDVFRFPQGPPDLSPWTLRRMTSSAGQLFDPLVLLGPATLPAKLLIQYAWRYQDSWDDELPECLGKKMSLYCKNQGQLSQIQIPRCIGDKKGQLVVFTDASTMAQAAAAYWVTETTEGIESHLVASKSKVTGLRQHEHIGRLELVGAVLGVALALKIALAYRIPMESVTYFTDSMSVLYWLSTTAQLSAYTGHRVAKIGERSRFSQWHYVHTSANPSDLPTRGMRAKELARCELWWHGPEFLRQPRHQWPEQPLIRSTEASAAETRTVEEIATHIIMHEEGKEEECEKSDKRNQLELIQRLTDRGHKLRKTMRLLARLSETMHQKFGHPGFDMVFSKWETCWIQHEQKLVLSRLYQEL